MINLFIIWFGYILLVFLINTVLYFLFPNSIKIHYYKGKWGKKKEPLYRLEKRDWGENEYGVNKYHIEYDSLFLYDYNEFISTILFFHIPLYSLFKFPSYNSDGVIYGNLSKEEVLELGPFDLEKFYEEKHDEIWYKRNLEITKEQEEENKIKEINKEFYEHY